MNIPRLAEVSQLKTAICKAYAERLKRQESTRSFAIRPLRESNILVTDAIQSTRDFLDLTRFLDDRFVIHSLID